MSTRPTLLTTDRLIMRPHTRDDFLESYAMWSDAEVIRYIGTSDPTSRRVLESILASEEEHAEDLSSLLKHLVNESAPAI